MHPRPRPSNLPAASLRAPLRLAVLLTALAGCGDDPTRPTPEAAPPPPAPAALVLAGPSAPIMVGTSHAVTATVRDQYGQVMAGQPVRWASRDSSTARVDSAGGLDGVNTGEAWIVATAGTLSDSLLVDVRYAVTLGETRLRLVGEGDRLGSSDGGESTRFDFLGRADGDVQIFEAWGRLSDSTGIGVLVVVPGRIPAGRTPLGAWSMDLLHRTLDAVDVPVALVTMRAPNQSAMEMVALERGTLELTYLSEPPGPGPRTGEVQGRLVAAGVGYDVEVGDDGNVSTRRNGREYRLAADLHVLHRHLGMGSSDGSVTFDGTVIPWLRQPASGNSWDVLSHVGLWNPRRQLTVDVSWPHPQGKPTGRWSFRYVDAATPRAVGYLSFEEPDPPQWAPAATGVYEVTRFHLPSVDVVGELAGRIDGVFLTRDLRPFEVKLDFVVPVPVPSAPAAGSTVAAHGEVGERLFQRAFRAGGAPSAAATRGGCGGRAGCR